MDKGSIGTLVLFNRLAHDMTTPTRKKKPEELRSQQWFGRQDRDGFAYRSWVKGKGVPHDGGKYIRVDRFRQTYLDGVTKGHKLSRPIKTLVACGNGTGGGFAPEALKRIGCDVIEMDCALDYTFPNYNPNPEDLHMLHAIAERVKATGAEIGIAIDGDGDRCGVGDDKGNEIFADKIGVLLARDLSSTNTGAQFVVDVKSTGLFLTDPVLKANGVKTDYWKTGHSYIKRRVTDLKALAGFEKSGHFFFNAPIGRGYDDGMAPERRGFLYMPFEHSETLRDQLQSLLLFTALGNQFFSTDVTGPMASLPVVIFKFALSPYADWQKLAWSGALIITFAVLALSITARALAASRNPQ